MKTLTENDLRSIVPAAYANGPTSTEETETDGQDGNPADYGDGSPE